MTKISRKEVFKIIAGVIIMTLTISPAIAIGNSATILPIEQLSATDPDGGNISSGQTIIGTIDPIGETDAFRFYGKAGQMVVIRMVSINNVTPKFGLYNATGNLDAESCYYCIDYRLEYKLKTTGIYTIIVTSRSTTLTGKYSLSFVIMPGPSSSKQDTDGGDIISEQTYPGNISISGDMDVFTFYGKKDEGVVIDMTTNSGNAAPMINLYNSSGQETSSAGVQHTRIEGYTLKQTGIYTIIVSLLSPYYYYARDTNSRYNLSFVKMPSTIHGISNIYPTDKSTVTDLNQYFKWGIEGNIAAKYDVYFGEDIITPLNKIGNNVTLRELKFPAMQYGKTYYWHVEAKTSTGTIQGPYWWFNTKNPVGCVVSTIYGYKFNDVNGNKTRDIGEAGISNWIINLKGYDTCTGKLVSITTTTNNTGYYRFGTINPGVYIVYEDFVLGWLPTASAAYTVTVPSISTNIKRDFGNKK